ncbi:hypothetical protein ACFL3O_01350, partial [Candidatus Neomarinimicrobiota bacterium]
MKYLYSIFIVLLFSCNSTNKPAHSQTKEPVNYPTNPLYEEHGLYGNIELYESTSYMMEDNFGKISRGPQRSTHKVFFAANGNMVEGVSYGSDGSLWGKYTYVYSENNKLLEETEFDEEENIDTKNIYKYGDNGFLANRTKYSSDGSPESRRYYFYNEYGLLVEEIDKTSFGSMNWKETYKYDEAGRKIRTNDYDSEGLRMWWTYKHDEKGDMIERKEFQKDGKVQSIKTFEYDINGNETFTRRLV